VPGIKNSLVGVYTLKELRGPTKARKGGNKTQVVVLHLIGRLLKPPTGSGYYVFLNNLFVSTKLVGYACAQGIGVIGIYRNNGGVI
jgi:hypothetical protein